MFPTDKNKPDLLLDVSVLVHVLGHQVEELVEADAPVPILVDLSDHLLPEQNSSWERVTKKDRRKKERKKENGETE